MIFKYLKSILKRLEGQSRSLSVYFLVAALCGPSLASAKILVISDIDDTLKVSHVLSTVGAVTSAADDDSHFVGMMEIFRGLERTHKDIEFHYVSLAPKLLMGGRHQEFLEENGFPVTKLHMNPGVRQDPQLKQKIIRKLLVDSNPELVIYFGDNGQFDVVVYDDMVREFPRIPAVTYIREAYSGQGESEHPTLSHQIGFVTSVEVAMDLINKALLPAASYASIESTVYKRILRDDADETFGPMVFPWWQDCRDFKWRWPVAEPSSQLVTIKRVIDKKCQ
jgi:hypothetical protein